MVSIKPFLLLVACLFGVIVSAQNTVLNIIQNTPELSSFNQYLTSPANARLYNLLSNPNTKLTIFAPVNPAFDQFRQLLTQSGNPLLDRMLSRGLYYHVIPDQLIMSKDLSDGFRQYATLYNMLTTPSSRRAFGSMTYEVPQDLMGGMILFGKAGNFDIFRGLGIPAHLVKTDVLASNGVIHFVDQVLSPPLDIMKTLQWHGLTKMMETLKLANVMDAFRSFTNVTFIVPTNEALARFMSTQANITPDMLRNILLRHVIPGSHFSQDLIMHPDIKVITKSGEMLRFSNYPGRGISLGGAFITKPDLLTESGVLHVVDRVLSPGNVQAADEGADVENTEAQQIGVPSPMCNANLNCVTCTQGTNCAWCGITNACLNAINLGQAQLTCTSIGGNLLVNTVQCP